MKSRRNPQFHKTFDRLPPEVKDRAREAYRHFQENPYHPSLQFKRVHATKPIYSARIGRDYRALGIRREDVIIWFWIGPQAEYDKLLSQL